MKKYNTSLFVLIIFVLSGCGDSVEERLTNELSLVRSENLKLRKKISHLEEENKKYKKLIQRYNLDDIQPDNQYKGGVFNEVYK